MTSATLGGGGVNQILTFADRGGRGGQPKSDIWLTHADGGGGCPKKLIQNYTLDERKNEVNGSNNEINQSDILLILFSQGLKT